MFKVYFLALGMKTNSICTLDDFKTCVTKLEITINRSCLNFIAEIRFTIDESTCFMSPKRNEFNFLPQEKEPQILVTFLSNGSVCPTPVPKKVLPHLLSSKTSYPEQSKSVNSLKVGSMQSWNKFKFKCPSSLSCFNTNNGIFQPW